MRLLDFVKGHMGGNTIVLLHGEQVPPGREVEAALRALASTHLCGHEAALLYPPKGDYDLGVKIVGLTSKRFISACGGVTQVLGRALFETDIPSRYGIVLSQGQAEVLLKTDAGITEVNVVHDGVSCRVSTDMKAFVGECYERGVGSIDLHGIEAMQVGKFLVLNAHRVMEKHPDVDFDTMDAPTRDLLVDLQGEFKRKTSESNLDFALYDWNARGLGDLRAVFPHNIPTGHIEPACGTGTVAIGIACFEAGELADRMPPKGSGIDLRLETGGGPTLVGPDITDLHLGIENGRVGKACFSHSRVEVTCIGRVWI